MAEGLLLVPDKLAQKIIRLKFVEMRKMMPEMWTGEGGDIKEHSVLATA